MNKCRTAAISFAALSIASALSGVTAFAKANDASMKNASLENDFIRLTVEQDSSQSEYLHFHLDTNNGQTISKDDDNKTLTYKNFYSGYTTININGEYYIYGEGTDTQEPVYDISTGSHTSAQKFGDVEIKQTLTFAEGFTKDNNDMLRISYKVISADENDKIGVRILLDPMIENDDALKLSVNDISIGSETAFNESVPDVWQADIRTDKNISAYGKNNVDTLKPDSLTLANWNMLYDELWDTPYNTEKAIDDSAIAVKWEPLKAVGKEFVSYYGIKNEAIDTKKITGKTVISSPKTSTVNVFGITALFAVSAVSAAGCIIIGRKEKKKDE